MQKFTLFILRLMFDQQDYQVDFVSLKGGSLAISGIANATVAPVIRNFFRDKKYIQQSSKRPINLHSILFGHNSWKFK